MRRKRRGQVAWNQAEIAVLMREWHDVTERTLRTLLAKARPEIRKRTWLAVRQMAKKLGLPSGVPQGCETIKQAAARTNYSQEGLAALLKRQGVMMRRMYSTGRVRKHGSPYSRRWAETEEIDAAIARELQLADTGYWARQYGIGTSNLRQILRRRGIGADLERGYKLRVAREQVEAALADYVPRKRAA